MHTTHVRALTSEGFGTPACEMMASQTPAACTNRRTWLGHPKTMGSCGPLGKVTLTL